MESANNARQTGSPNLSLVSTFDLVAELKKRHDSFIVAGVMFKSMEQYDILRDFSGNRLGCLGLLNLLQYKISTIENDSLRPRIE